MNKLEKLKKEKEEVIKSLPDIGEIIRGSFIEVYLECIRKVGYL